MKTKDDNVVNEARSGQGREKMGNRVGPYRCYHLALVTVSVIKLRVYIVNPLWPRPRSRILLASLTSLARAHWGWALGGQDRLTESSGSLGDA